MAIEMKAPLALDAHGAGFLEAEPWSSAALPVAQDHVVEEPDAEQFRTGTQPVREPSIRVAGSRVAAGMVVHQNEGVGAVEKSRTKDLARMRNAFVQAAEGDLVRANEAQFRIEQNDA